MKYESMARLRRPSPVEDESSDDARFGRLESGAAKDRGLNIPITKVRKSPRKIVSRSYATVGCSDSEDSTRTTSRPRKAKTPTQNRGRQIRLAPLTGTLSSSKLLFDDTAPTKNLLRHGNSNETKLFEKFASSPIDAYEAASQILDVSEGNNGCLVSESEASPWCKSDSSSDDSEEELPSLRKFLRLPPKIATSEHSAHNYFPEKTEGPKPIASRPNSSSDKENNAAFLRFSPPRLHSPRKQQGLERPVTPPQSPTKSRLQSPSKAKSQAPTPPLRQSLDAFWNSNVVNEWNDRYSPHKILTSPRKLKLLQDEAIKSPISSPRKLLSPSKTTRIERNAKKTFDTHKRAMAEAFFDELDRVVTNSKIRELAASTGGVHLVWSKTLNSTAGRANWRKETSHIRILDGTTEVSHKHHASVELAEKVIDDENRLLNVIAHEFCHLANFMISGIKNEPHGRQFKAWGKKCTEAFRDRGVEVTTKHSYEIEYKFVWQCSNEDCAAEFKRHSKSLDPKRHTCGSCRSQLIQIKPAPRRDAGTITGYAAYVKAHFAEVKRGMPHASQKEVMEAVARKYRVEKASNRPATVEQTAIGEDRSTNDVEAMVQKLEVIILDDD